MDNDTIPTQPAQAPQKSLLEGRRVLWVEDDKFLGDILERKFASVGCEITRAKSPDLALKFLETNVPEAIVLDLLLPGMSGFDLLQMIRSKPALRNIPVMILSNMNNKADLEKGKLLGVKKYLVKAAASLDEIIREVADILK